MATIKRNQVKIKKILQQRGYKDGEVPRGKVVHHIKPIAEGGKDTPKNIRVVSKSKHIKIHERRRERGET